jgi:hypothetical protein
MSRRKTTDCGLRTTDYGPRTTDHGPQIQQLLPSPLKGGRASEASQGVLRGPSSVVQSERCRRLWAAWPPVGVAEDGDGYLPKGGVVGAQFVPGVDVIVA